MKSKEVIQNLLASADVRVNGDRPWDIKVKNENFYGRVLRRGNLGLGESYMDDWWEVEQMDELFYRLVKFDVASKAKLNWRLLFWAIGQHYLNQQRGRKSFKVGEQHYDAGNDLYQAMLGKRMAYTCGYWPEAKDLDEAQEAKLDLTCRKLGLKKGMRLLDIGCGWGSLVKFAAEKYGVSAVGITISKEQVEYTKKLCQGLPIEIRLQDYRKVNEKFDRIASLGMFEHVGNKNYREYMKVAARNLTDDGLFLLHTIGGDKSVKSGDPWLERYIFPNSMLPSIAQIGKSIEEIFVMEDWHNFGHDYYLTLKAWFKYI